MGHPLMAFCVLVALALPTLICGRPAADDGGSVLSVPESRISKPDDFSDLKAISSLIEHGNLSILTKPRQRRLSDQRLAELETLMTLSKLCLLLTKRENGFLDPVRIGRRRRFAMDQAPTEIVHIKAKHIGDPAYPLIS